MAWSFGENELNECTTLCLVSVISCYNIRNCGQRKCSVVLLCGEDLLDQLSGVEQRYWTIGHVVPDLECKCVLPSASISTFQTDRPALAPHNSCNICALSKEVLYSKDMQRQCLWCMRRKDHSSLPSLWRFSTIWHTRNMLSHKKKPKNTGRCLDRCRWPHHDETTVLNQLFQKPLWVDYWGNILLILAVLAFVLAGMFKQRESCWLAPERTAIHLNLQRSLERRTCICLACLQVAAGRNHLAVVYGGDVLRVYHVLPSFAVVTMQLSSIPTPLTGS